MVKVRRSRWWRWEDEVVSALVSSQCTLFPKFKNTLFFLEFPFYFLEVPFCFPENPFYLMCVSFKTVFSRWFHFLLVLLRAAQKGDICLVLKTCHGVMFLMYFIQVLVSVIVCNFWAFRIAEINWLKAFNGLFQCIWPCPFFSKIAPDVSKCILKNI